MKIFNIFHIVDISDCVNPAGDPRVLTTGKTEIIIIAGHPIRQVRSPDLFNRWFCKNGLDRTMVPIETNAASLPDLFRLVRNAGNCRGMVLTTPLKQAALALVDSVGPNGRFLGCVNTVRRNRDGSLSADMMDGPGFWNGAAEMGFEPDGKGVLLIGSGAAASAIAHSLMTLNGTELFVTGQDKEQVDRLHASVSHGQMQVRKGCPADLSSIDMVINATPLGMDHCPGMPIERSLMETLPQHAMAADIVTDPVETEFLKTAEALGFNTIPGEAMTRGQFRLIGSFLGIL